MALKRAEISVCNDGNVSQVDASDNDPNGRYYRIEVYRCSQPGGGYGITLSGSRVEAVCGRDHLTEASNRVFRYTFSVGTMAARKGELPIVLEGREEFNPPGMPEGSWDVRIRDLDPESPSYGSILHVTARPTGKDRGYELSYALHLSKQGIEPAPVHSPLTRRLSELNPGLDDLSSDLDQLARPVSVQDGELTFTPAQPLTVVLNANSTPSDLNNALEGIRTTLSHPDFAKFRHHLSEYEALGDFRVTPPHPGTNLVGPDSQAAAESMLFPPYRAALVLLGPILSPDAMRAAQGPRSAPAVIPDTGPHDYTISVGAVVDHRGCYSLSLDKVYSDYGGIPMRLAPGSRLENEAAPIADASRCIQTLGEIAGIHYLSEPSDPS